MGHDFSYQDVLDQLKIAGYLGSADLAHTFEQRLNDVEKRCTQDLQQARNENEQLRAELGKSQAEVHQQLEAMNRQYAQDLQQAEKEKQKIMAELEADQMQSRYRTDERNKHLSYLERQLKRFRTTTILFALLWLLMVGFGRPLFFPQNNSDLSRPFQKRPFSVICPDQAIEALGLLADAHLIDAVISGEELMATTTAFSLVPITNQAIRGSNCQFIWTIFYGTTVIVWRGQRFIPDQTIIVADQPINPMSESTCQLLLSVAPFDKYGRPVNNTSFQIHVEECPYS